MERAINPVYKVDFALEENPVDPDRPSVQLIFYSHGEPPRVEELGYDMARLLIANMELFFSRLEPSNQARRR